MSAALLATGLVFVLGLASLPSVDDAVREAVEVAEASQAEQRAALANAQEAFASSNAAFDRLRLATLLATLPPPLGDDARAAELLRDLDDVRPDAARFAALLDTQVAERQRLKREVEQLSRKVERLTQARSAAEKKRRAAEQERLAAEKERDKREERMRHQLQALQAIERAILERDERLRRKPYGSP